MNDNQKKRLGLAMEGIEQMWTRRGIYGGREVTQMQDFRRRFDLLMNPQEDADALANEIEAFVGQNLKYVRMRQEQAEADEATQKVVEVARAEAHRAHAEAQEANSRRKRDYQAEAVVARAAIDEIF